MSTLFDGIDDQWQAPIGGCNLTGAYTLVSLIKLDAGVSWQSYLGNDASVTGSEVALARHSDATIGIVIGGGAGGFFRAISHSSADGWMLAAGRRPAGTNQVIRLSKYPIGGSPTHADGGTFLNNPATQAGGKVVFGQIDAADFFKGKAAVCAEFASYLSDANIESLVTTFTRANWLSLTPVGLWDATDQFASDWTGGGATPTVTGTTSSADDPAGWASWAGATALPIAWIGAAG